MGLITRQVGKCCFAINIEAGYVEHPQTTVVARSVTVARITREEKQKVLKRVGAQNCNASRTETIEKGNRNKIDLIKRATFF